MKKIGFVTSSQYKDLFQEEHIVLKLLLEKDVEAVPVVWSDEAVNWQEFDFLVMRTVWDYTERYEEFCEWLEKIDNLGLMMFNETKLLRWNSHKKYLLELEKEGIQIIPTLLIEQGTKLDDVIKQATSKDWGIFVLKPCISSCGQNCHKIESSNSISSKFRSQLQNLLSNRDMLVQKFISSVKVKGEISLIYFNENYSHAILKKPLQNEFKVQGGKIDVANATQPQIEFGKKILKAARKIMGKKGDKDLILIARVDLLFSNDGMQLYLNELEVFDPELFLRKSNTSPNLYVNAIMSLIKKGNNYY